jgi:hypothetical protein
MLRRLPIVGLVGAAQGPAPNTTAAAAVFGPGVVVDDSDETCYVSATARV